MIFGFSSTSALRCFAAAPEATLEGVRRAVQRAPLLAHMLRVTGPLVRGISDSTSSNDSSSSSSSGSVSGASYSLPGAPVAVPPLQQLIAMLDSTPLLVEAGVQTLTHTDDGKWDWQYEWNEWALRRKVRQLCHLAANSQPICLLLHELLASLALFRFDQRNNQPWCRCAVHLRAAVLLYDDCSCADHCACQPEAQGNSRCADTAQPLSEGRQQPSMGSQGCSIADGCAQEQHHAAPHALCRRPARSAWGWPCACCVP
jgi:hypothetical protein